MKKKVLSLLLVLAICLSAVACDEEESEPAPDETGKSSVAREIQDGSWAIYWYLCGSDLETEGGCATDDLIEMLEVTLPENVNVVIQTGGAAEWQNEYMKPDKLQRWLYDSEDLYLLEEIENASMGDAQTLYEFLDFANTNYPADKVAVIFWDHGGGSVGGAVFDENYDMDALDLVDMYAGHGQRPDHRLGKWRIL